MMTHVDELLAMPFIADGKVPERHLAVDGAGHELGCPVSLPSSAVEAKKHTTNLIGKLKCLNVVKSTLELESLQLWQSSDPVDVRQDGSPASGSKQRCSRFALPG